MALTVVDCFSAYKIPVKLLHGTEKEINRWLAKRGLDPLNKTAAANYRIYPSDNPSVDGVRSIISLVKGSGGISEICALLHEVIHYAVYTFNKVGITVTDVQDEPFCYFVESIMHQCLVGINKAKS